MKLQLPAEPVQHTPYASYLAGFQTPCNCQIQTYSNCLFELRKHLMCHISILGANMRALLAVDLRAPQAWLSLQDMLTYSNTNVMSSKPVKDSMLCMYIAECAYTVKRSYMHEMIGTIVVACQARLAISEHKRKRGREKGPTGSCG